MAINSLNTETTIEELIEEEQKYIERDIDYINTACQKYGIKTWNDLSTIIGLVDRFRDLNRKGVMFQNDM